MKQNSIRWRVFGMRGASVFLAMALVLGFRSFAAAAPVINDEFVGLRFERLKEVFPLIDPFSRVDNELLGQKEKTRTSGDSEVDDVIQEATETATEWFFRSAPYYVSVFLVLSDTSNALQTDTTWTELSQRFRQRMAERAYQVSKELFEGPERLYELYADERLFEWALYELTERYFYAGEDVLSELLHAAVYPDALAYAGQFVNIAQVYQRVEVAYTKGLLKLSRRDAFVTQLNQLQSGEQRRKFVEQGAWRDGANYLANVHRNMELFLEESELPQDVYALPASVKLLRPKQKDYFVPANHSGVQWGTNSIQLFQIDPETAALTFSFAATSKFSKEPTVVTVYEHQPFAIYREEDPEDDTELDPITLQRPYPVRQVAVTVDYPWWGWVLVVLCFGWLYL